MVKHNWLGIFRAPVLVKNLYTVVCGHEAHVTLSI